MDALRARTSDEFLIRDVPGTSGRLDVVCRILVATYRTLPELSPSIQVNAILGGPPNPPLRVRVEKVELGEFPQSELECALILKALLHRYQKRGMSKDSQWPQFTIAAQDFSQTLQAAIHPKNQILYLTETGQPLQQIDLNLDQPILLIIGDDRGLSDQHKKEVYRQPIQEVSIGTRTLLGSHVISLVLLELMRRKEQK